MCARTNGRSKRSMSRRTERLGSLLKQELAVMIQQSLTDPRITGFPSVTRVKVAEDLSTADVYIISMGTEVQQNLTLTAIRHSGGLMRTRLTKVLSLRQVPILKFHLDEQLKKELAVLDLLKKVDAEKAEMEEREAKQALIDAEEAKRQAEKDAAIEARRAAEAAAREDGETDEELDEETYEEIDETEGEDDAGGEVAEAEPDESKDESKK